MWSTNSHDWTYSRLDLGMITPWYILVESCLRVVDSWITQLKAQGPSMTCHESKEEEKGFSRLCTCFAEVGLLDASNVRWLGHAQHAVIVDVLILLNLRLRRGGGRFFALFLCCVFRVWGVGLYINRWSSLNLSGNEVYYMIFSIILVKSMLCSKLRCQRDFNLIMSSYKVGSSWSSSTTGSSSLCFFFFMKREWNQSLFCNEV